MKKTRIVLATAVCALMAGTSFAQDVKEIVKKHNEAVGGAEKWSKIKSLKKEGTMTVMGMEMPVTFIILKGKGMRQDFSVMGSSNYVILTPTAGWMFIPAQGQKEPTAMPAEQLTDVASQLDFQDKIMDASAKKHAIELQGKEDIDGKPAFKLKVTDAEKAIHTYYVDASTWYLVRAVEEANVQGQKMEVTVNYSNFSKLPSGIVIAMKEDSGESGIMNLTKVEENTVTDESVFKP